MNDFNNLLYKINNAKELDFGDIISNSIELFKKVWLKGLVVVLFVLISAICISFLFGLIGLAPALDHDIFNDSFDFKAIATFYSSSAIYGIPQNMLISTLNIAFVAAFYRICKQTILGENGHEDYFYFFKKEYFTKVFMLGIIYTAITTVAQFLCFIPYIYVFVPLSYFAVILANNPNLSEMEIVKASFTLGNKKWLITFGTMFVAGLVAMLGILGCVIGIVFTMSIIYLPSFLIYKDAIGFDGTNVIDEIGMNNEF
ncbi:hypothetical protein [Confluentibacter flavum]|uniref:Beta-carotene 15,15'-monooxygenase n=1 Tax=Confluentibacter flavum TaxID=1909700 RepID=A0A2N3HHQ8_9FLAO|nr:hypothetical protein [Confluentibacter flavum]PKQ44507.1 hypothetical protein CSW08_12700 [Confluentibacter flavum]